MQIAPSGYWLHAKRRRQPELRPERTRSDERLAAHIERVYDALWDVYGARKVWRQLRREGTPAARCTVERLMRARGLRGVIRGKVVRTTIANANAPCPLDRVNRVFKAQRPNELWVSEFTYVSTWQGWL
jgi:transposase InsO family protein